jgi:epoxyqueuosine reductase
VRHSIETALDAAGLRHRVVSAGLIAEMGRTLAQLRDRDIMPAEIYAEYSRSLACVPPEGMEEVRSLIVVAAPSPPLTVAFHLGDRRIEAMVPPTYVSNETRMLTLEILRGVLGQAGHAVQKVALPAKVLAVRVGLAEYGLNGLAYVEGLGSLARLDVYATDADLLEGGTEAGLDSPERLPVPARMKKCAACGWCYHACPTRCISSSGDRIDPLRCLTYLNEHEGEWPPTLDSRTHNSLVGCMVCQLGCPANQDVVLPGRLIVTFDREETEIILKDLHEDELPEGLRKKRDSIDLAEYSTVLGRNLRALAGV